MPRNNTPKSLPQRRKFAGVKPLPKIKAQAKTAGIAVDDFNFRTNGADYVCVGVESGTRPDGSSLVFAGSAPRLGYVMFNTFNGTFFGAKPDGTKFDSGTTTFENEAWFQQLLEFFYVTE